MARSSSRRQFLKATSVGAAALSMTATSFGRLVGANDRISVGIIGCGQRGVGAHMPGVHAHAETQNVEITAVAVLMAVRAHDTGRRQIYDPEHRQIRDG